MSLIQKDEGGDYHAAKPLYRSVIELLRKSSTWPRLELDFGLSTNSHSKTLTTVEAQGLTPAHQGLYTFDEGPKWVSHSLSL